MASSTTNWFVAPETKHGDGSREKPFHDPWLALRSAGPGDVIHIAAGNYFGRYDRSSWLIECPNLTLRGGYSRDFSQRTPWQTPSVFSIFPGYEAPRENYMIGWREKHSGLTLDGLFFDASGANTYSEKPGGGLSSYPEMSGAIASFNAEEVTIRNCVFANSATGGVELSGDRSRFENNLVINIIGTGMLDLRSASAGENQPIVVANNTFCFAQDETDPPLGTGGEWAIGVRINRAALVQENVFIGCGNAAIALYKDLERVSIDRNLFYLTPRDIVNFRGLNAADITESNIDEMEDLGLKSSAGNIIQDPAMTGFKTEWLDAYSRHLMGNYAKPPREAANALRTAAGLPALSPADLEKTESKGALAPRLAPSDALALRFAAKQGYHTAELPTEIATQDATASPTYRSIDWSAIETPDPALANQRVELRVGLGYEQNTTLLADANPETHMGIRIYQPGSDDGSIFVLARRYSLVNRQFEEGIKNNNGREVENAYFLRGVYRTDIDPPSRQKVTLVVESFVPAPLLAANSPARPQGRDWFVRAGASGGDGTREKPFRDPFQALDKAEGGDAIHVTGGDYFGKLHSGKWKILVRYLTLLGGYDTEFTERDPWKNPTRFLLTEEEKAKGMPEGTILDSEENSEGLVLDGFIFDGATYNNYTADGSLDVRRSPSSALVSLRGGRAPITVRNCLFMNACGTGVIISCPFGVFENNILLNTSGWSLGIRAEGPGPWTIKNNTILFACDPTPRAGTGKSSSDGTLFMLNGRAVAAVESNIFAFADNFGVRTTLEQQNTSFDNNVFAANLFNHLTDTQYLWTDSSNLERRAEGDSAFASFKGNTLALPRLPVDPAFADAALARLFTLPSRISGDEWKTFATQIGSAATPATPADTAAAVTETPKPAAAPKGSLDDLLASIRSIDTQMKEIESHKTAAASAPTYCSAFDWKKALTLAQETPATEPGAHKLKLTVSFAAARVQTQVQYTPLTPQKIDADHASLDNMPVELEITDARSYSNNPSLFPSGMTKDDYDAYSIAAAEESTRTRIAIVVRLDTAASKLLNRTTPTDRLRVRGTARLPGNPAVLAIVVDTVEAVER